AALEAGQPAPAFDLEDLGVARVDLESLRGKVVVLNFWATWCGPCRAELPLLDALNTEHADDGVVVLGVNIDRRPQKAAAVWRRLGIQMRSAWDEQQQVVAVYDPPAMPTTYVIDPEGTVRWVEEGALDSDTLEGFAERVTALVVPPPSEPTEAAPGDGPAEPAEEAPGDAPEHP
ncbi:MAG: TlpA family protein disulfide reductase, partial [Deltaproteobacteria bacterium]|nr:TlpA family protein disulfide reductase [Deltaproteobacteria bacterium]